MIHHDTELLAVCIIGFIVAIGLLCEACIADVRLAEVYLQLLANRLKVDDSTRSVGASAEIVYGLGVDRVLHTGLS